MKKIICQRCVVALVLMMLIACIIPARVTAATAENFESKDGLEFSINEETNTLTIYNPADWALLFDGSGSMRGELDKLGWETLAYWFGSRDFDLQARFDTKLHIDKMDYISHDDTDIVGALEQAVEVHHISRVVIVTDGHQDPGIFDSLTEKNGIDLHLILVGDNENSEELISVLKERLNKENCSLTIYKGHLFEPVYESYAPPKTEVPYEDNSEVMEQKVDELNQQIDDLNKTIMEMEKANQESYQNIQNQLVLIVENTEFEHNPFCWIGWCLDALVLMIFFCFLIGI